MDNPFSSWFGEQFQGTGLADVITPSRTFEDVILPESTERALNSALVQIEKHDLLYHKWGLAERHRDGLGLAFNFAGPPGTGKTICAEAVAHRLNRKLMVVRHADMQSMWVGRTGKNVTSVFEAAHQQDAVLFFDEADAIAGSRFGQLSHGYEREANATVNVLLRELEQFSGVVIFATNLATTLDPAFERRIRTHVLFEKPSADLRAKIWRVQLHERKTPLASNVDFEELAEKYDATGGDIKNAVLKAAQSAIAEPGPDEQKQIHQHHFADAMEEVLQSKEVMQQSLLNPTAQQGPHLPQEYQQAIEEFEAGQSQLRQTVTNLLERQEKIVNQLQQLGDKQDSFMKRFAAGSRQGRTTLSVALLALGLAIAAMALAFLL